MRLCEPIVLMASGKRGDDAVDGGLFKEQRLAAAGRFHFAVGDFGDFELGGDGLGNAFEFAGAVELRRQNRERIQKPYASEAGTNWRGWQWLERLEFRLQPVLLENKLKLEFQRMDKPSPVRARRKRDKTVAGNWWRSYP